jgi:hypothetical protein
MNRTTATWLFLVALGAGALGAGCDGDDKPAVQLAPTSSALAAPPPKAAATNAAKLVIDKDSSKVDFLMEAPKEKIHGKVAGGTTGELQVDFMDLTKSTGLVNVDLGKLELYQAVVDDKGAIGAEKKEDKQNEHARNWLEIGKDTPEDKRKQFVTVQFAIKSILVDGEKDLTKMTGAERKVMLKATGDFLLHGHKTEKTAELEATFAFEGDKPVSVHVKTVKPMAVGLAENDVKPRDAIGKLLAKGLEELAPKVAREAPITLDFTAKVAAAQPAVAPK